MDETDNNSECHGIFDKPMQQWVTSGSLSSPWHDGNNNRAKKLLFKRRDSFNAENMTSRRASISYDDDDNYVKVSKVGLKSDEVLKWDDEAGNNSDNDTKSKFDEAFSEGSTTSSCEKDGDNGTEIELRLRVRRFDEENANLRDELLRTEETANRNQRQFYLLQKKFDQLKEKCDHLLRENDEQRETISTIETQEKRCQVALQKVDKERNALIEKLRADKEDFNRSLEKLNRDKLDCAKQLTIFKSRLETKEIECDTLQEKLNEVNELVSSLEEHYEKTIRFLQDKSDDLKNENAELKMRLMNLECPPTLDQEVCTTPLGYLDSSSENMPYQNDQKVQLQNSLYAELKASGFSIEEIKYDAKIRELEQELDWYNSEIFEAARQIQKIIEELKKTRRRGQVRNEPDDLFDTETSPIFIIFDKITMLSREVSETLKKPPMCDSSSQVSTDSQNTIEHLRNFGIATFQDCLRSPIKLTLSRPINNDNVFLTLKIQNPKDKQPESSSIKNNFNNDKINRIETSSLNAAGSMFSSEFSSGPVYDKLSSKNIEIPSKINTSTPSKNSQINGKLSADDFNEKNNLSLNNEIYPLSSTPLLVNNKIKNKKILKESIDIDLLSMSNKKLPRRKLSVFQRSFDIDTVFEVQDNGGISESHKLSERINCDTINYDKNDLIDTNKTNGNDKNNLYRTISNNSQSSESSASPSPIKLNTWQEEDTLHNNDNNKKINIHKFKLQPAKLNFMNKSDNMDNSVMSESNCDDFAVNENPENGKIKNCEDNTGETAVVRMMSSDEDSSVDTDTDSQEIDENCDYGGECNVQRNYLINSFTRFDGQDYDKNLRDKNDWRPPKIRRSMSEGDNMDCGGGGDGCRGCNINQNDDKKQDVKKETEVSAFPSLSDARLQESGIAHLSDSEDLEGKDLGEEELERKYLAFSLGLCTDRVTLTHRRALSLRQRDQTEHNLAIEISKMHQSIQEFAPLCFDSETIERIELACNQVEIIAQCAHRVSCTAETLGAMQQEYRISRAIHIADRYLKVLRDRCDKLVADITEKKRILSENNIVIDEPNGEYEGSPSAMRYRALSPTTNRTMMARRRASIATIFRPIGIVQDGAKDNIRQRNSVSGRVTIRRPSFSSESGRFETEKLNRTDSSSVGELRDAFEQAESRRTSREENNNLIRNQIIVCENESVERRMSNSREEPMIETLAEEQEHELHEEESRFTEAGLSLTSTPTKVMSWRLMLWCTVISFFIGFYVKDAVSTSSQCTAGAPLKWWSIEEIFRRQLPHRNTAPRPI